MITAVLIVSCLVLSKLFLKLDTDWLVLFRSDRPEIATLLHWRETLPGSKDMAVIISGGSLRQRQEVAQQLGTRFAQYPDLLEDPLYSLPTEIFIDSGLYYLAADQLLELEREGMNALAGTKDLDLSRTADLVYLTDVMAESKAGSELLAQGLEAFVMATSPDSVLTGEVSLVPELVPESSQISRYLGDFREVPEVADLSLDGGKTLLVLVRPKIGTQALEAAAPAVEKVREVVQQVRRQYKSTTLSLTGEPVLVVDERGTIARDSIRGTVCSFILVMILFQFGFREFLRPCLALASLLVGLTWTLGLVSLTIGHLNFITITYIPILVGIGLDFGIHMAFRYFEQRQEQPAQQAMHVALEGAGRDTLFGAFTTSAAFGVLAVIGFRGVSELGTIALCGVLLCQISACTFLPACLAFLESYGYELPKDGRQDLSGVEETLCRWDKPILLGTLLATFLALFFAPMVGFNVHLLKMQNPRLESVQTELELVSEGKSSVLTALIAVPDLQTARRMEAQLRQLPTVAEVISLATFLPEVTPQKQKSVSDILAMRQALLSLLDFIREVPQADAKMALRLVERFQSLNLSSQRQAGVEDLLGDLQKRLKNRGPGPVMDALESLREETLLKLKSLEPLLTRQVARPVGVEQMPDSLTSRLLRKDGKLVIRVFPRVDIWQTENLHRFLVFFRSVSPEVSGEPVLIELFERLVLRTHWLGINFALLAMVLILFLVLRRARDVLMAATPTALSLLLIMGIMGFFGWEFNPANFVAVPMLLGIGSVFGLHSVLRMRELGHERLLSCSTGPAIVLSAATSMAGFASLGLADHRGIASLGWLVMLGLLINGFLSIALLPAWIRLRRKR